MKAKKKPKGTKARVQASKKRLAYIGTVITVAILVTIAAVSSFLIYSHLSPSLNQIINPDQTSNQTSQPKAAIVDHLSLTAPNKTFIQTARNTLEQAGYTVDYYPGEKVTVGFYRNLPTHNYKLVVLRVHSTAAKLQDEEFVETPVCLFTSEPYSRKYLIEQLTDQIVRASYTMPAPPYYFGIMPKFVTSSLNGRFQNSIVIMMGCEGLNNTKMAEAFIKKGAEVYISWKGAVSASHTDQATTQLLKHLITETQTIKQAVERTMKIVGPDPAHKSQLIYYPLEAGEQTIEDITGNPETNP
jgi:hypothetical protein